MSHIRFPNVELNVSTGEITPREVSGEAAPTKEFNADKAMVAVWKATIEMDSRDIERAALEMDVYEFRTFALSIVRRWLRQSQEIIR